MKVGSLVMCINKLGWMDIDTEELTPGPQYKEECVVSGFPKPGYITLEEYDYLSVGNDTNNYQIEQFVEIQPPMDIDIESVIEEPLNA